jgi:hypothetical protein
MNFKKKLWYLRKRPKKVWYMRYMSTFLWYMRYLPLYIIIILICLDATYYLSRRSSDISILFTGKAKTCENPPPFARRLTFSIL